MKLSVSLFVFALLFSFLLATSAHTHENFLQCQILHSGNDSISKVIYTPSNSSYSSVLKSSIRNTRFSTPSTPKPQVIVTPLGVSQIQETLSCSQKHGKLKEHLVLLRGSLQIFKLECSSRYKNTINKEALIQF